MSADSLTARFFDKFILARPKVVLLTTFLFVSFLGFQAKNFRLDASADSLILEDDQDLRNTREVINRYGGQDYVIVTYAPHGGLFSEATLANLSLLQEDLARLEGIFSVFTILDVPLLESPPIPIKELGSHVITLKSREVDKTLARVEIQNSPIYQNLLVSPDLSTTALQVVFPEDQVGKDLLLKRVELSDKRRLKGLSPSEEVSYKEIKQGIRKHNQEMNKVRHRNIAAIREVMVHYRGEADLFLGGVSMITDDLISFIKSDLKLFGLGVLFFMVITLKLIFQRKRWIIIPLICCFFSSISMIGFLGLFGWEVTVISSNFISLQLIITMAVTIHLIVRYRELSKTQASADNRHIILETVVSMLKPCLYAALTTIAGFASLVLCDILPVINFGWMMIAGISVSLLLTFILFPAVLMLMEKPAPTSDKESTFPLTSILAQFTVKHGTLIMVISGSALLFSVVGITRLVVENSFIDYFKKSTEIYQGMKIIDQTLGGTTPLDVIIHFDTEDEGPVKTDAKPRPSSSPGINTEEDEDFEDFEEFEEEGDADKYWFTTDKMALIKGVNDYLDKLPETGKVLSLGTMLKVAEKLNDGKPLDNFQLALLYSELPEAFRELILSPYVSVENNQARFAIRIRDSEKWLKRDLLLKKIRHDLVHQVGLKEGNFQLTGMLVLYNNMLQSLFDSQIKTLGITVIALILMFLVLFKSLKLSLIAIIPNLLSIGIVLGVMGWLGIPLDMMTITIAAISVGIAVDDTIHYIHRFKHEFSCDGNYIQTLYRCHESIGHAMYYTSVTIIIGFSILTLSNFIPSIYFGLLTGLAMVIALTSAMTLLPQLIVLTKAFGPELPAK